MKNLPVTSGARQDEEVPKSRRVGAGREAIKLMGEMDIKCIFLPGYLKERVCPPQCSQGREKGCVWGGRSVSPDRVFLLFSCTLGNS